MNQHIIPLFTGVERMRTDCDGCGNIYVLDVPEDILIGGECPKCGYYTTRYQPGQEVI